MKLLVIGGGAREHAMVTALARSLRGTQIFCAPGNPGTAPIAQNLPLGAESEAAIQELGNWASKQAIDLTVVGPELPLTLGVVDEFRALGLPIIGPTRAAARIESSKSWARDFMSRHGIPSPGYRVTEIAEELAAYLAEAEFPLVLKADGLAAGKGAVVARTLAEAREALTDMRQAGILGDAGGRETVVCEEFLEGREVSALAFTDGKSVVPMPPACDHKQLLDGGQGPMTGGMGGYSPVPWVSEEQWAEVAETVLRPAVDGMASEGCPFSGFLYAGLMMTADGPRVLEFNARFGDPEAQLLLPRLESDLAEILLAIAQERLDEITPDIRWSADVTCGVVLASEGYPAHSLTGRPISALDDLSEGVMAFQAGTRQGPSDPGIVTAGGRVLTLVGRGPTLEDARRRVYAAVPRVSFEGMQYRSDIGLL